MDLRVGGKFKLIKKCGSGAFGEIYQGKYNASTALADHVAVNCSIIEPNLTQKYLYIGTNVKTGDDVAIKLVSKVPMAHTGLKH